MMPQSPHSLGTLLNRVVKRSNHSLRHSAAELLRRNSQFETHIQDNFVIVLLAVRLDGTQHTFPGVAKREPDDVFDFAVGQNIALRRALERAQEFIEEFLVEPVVGSSSEPHEVMKIPSDITATTLKSTLRQRLRSPF